MAEFPRSLIEFQKRFPDEAACAAYLREERWRDGFVCPACGGVRGWGAFGQGVDARVRGVPQADAIGRRR